MIIVAAAFFVMQWSSRNGSTSAPPGTSAVGAEPRSDAPAEPSPVAAPRNETPAAVVTIIDAELCKTFSASGAKWQCTAPGDVVAPGRLVFYTKMKSQRDASVTHLLVSRQHAAAIRGLRISPNGTAGYRTYSRQTVGPGSGGRKSGVRRATCCMKKRFAVR